MSIDISKLTPAPWGVGKQGVSVYGPDHCAVVDTCNRPIADDDDVSGEECDLEFIALARNAFAGDPEALAWWEANRVNRSP